MIHPSPYVLLAALTAALSAQSPGPQRPRIATPQSLVLRSTHVEAHIQDRAATTKIQQVFFNGSGRVAEADWILPLPEGATADGFTMTVGGVEMEGDVLDATSARQIYQTIVRQRRDPGLLEYAGRGCLRARVFPIPAGQEVRVDVRYRQLLPETAGLRQWTFPIRATAATGLRSETFSLDVQIEAQQPLRTVYTPLPNVGIVRKGDHKARLSFELAGGTQPPRDLEVFYGLEERDFGLNLLSFRKDKEPGYFLMTLAPKQEWKDDPNTSRVVQFAVDVSGSMKGIKMVQAKAALRFFVQSLKPRDRFNIIPFSTEAEPFFPAPVLADAEHQQTALERIATLEATGGTNLEGALRVALQPFEAQSKTDRTNYVPLTVLLTDGKPSVGERDPARLVKMAQANNPDGQRVFVFGVGHDLNTGLLDRIADATSGSRDYVREDEDIEVKTGALFTRLSHPVMTNLTIEVEGADLFAMHPKKVPDLFRGDQITVLGRYRSPGEHAIHLTGTLSGERRQFVYEDGFATDRDSHDFIPSLWAERRVAVLLDELRLHGHNQELFDEVAKLGREFGIVTPMTSHLILEAEDRQRLLGAWNRNGPPAAGGGGGRTPGAAGPATGGPAGPSTPGPQGPGTGGPATVRDRRDGAVSASDDFFLGGGRGESKKATMDELVRDLVRVGALPKDADAATLQSMTARLGEELARSESSLRRMDKDQGGEKAVDTSLYLARLIRGEGRGKTLAQLLTRRVGQKTFHLRDGRWVDGAYLEMERQREQAKAAAKASPETDPKSAQAQTDKEPTTVKLVAYSEEWFALSTDREHLAPYLAFSTRMLLMDGDTVYEISDE